VETGLKIHNIKYTGHVALNKGNMVIITCQLVVIKIQNIRRRVRYLFAIWQKQQPNSYIDSVHELPSSDDRTHGLGLKPLRYWHMQYSLRLLLEWIGSISPCIIDHATFTLLSTYTYIYTSISIALISFTGQMKFISRWTSLALSSRKDTENTNDVENSQL